MLRQSVTIKTLPFPTFCLISGIVRMSDGTQHSFGSLPEKQNENNKYLIPSNVNRIHNRRVNNNANEHIP